MPLTTINHSKAPGEFLGRDYDFWTLQTVKAESDLTSQAVLDRVIEVVSLNGQPVLLGTLADGSNQTLKFATEHTGAWTAATLKTALITHGNFGSTAFANCTVTLATGL